MTLFQTIFLGIIQGTTEFLPISSSGHLVIAPYLLGWDFPPEEAFLFDVLVQLATLLAVFVYFRHDLLAISLATLQGLRKREPFSDPMSRLGWFLLLATIPAGAAGILFYGTIADTFNSPLTAALALQGTAALLLLAEYLGKRDRDLEDLHGMDALVIGIFQSLALIPGLSRSGATITGGMTRGLSRPSAARFSFLMSIPIMLAAGLSALVDLLQMPNLASLLPSFGTGFLSAGIVGYVSIRWLLGYLARHRLYIFAIYCVVLSLVTLASLMIRS